MTIDLLVFWFVNSVCHRFTGTMVVKPACPLLKLYHSSWIFVTIGLLITWFVNLSDHCSVDIVAHESSYAQLYQYHDSSISVIIA